MCSKGHIPFPTTSKNGKQRLQTEGVSASEDQITGKHTGDDDSTLVRGGTVPGRSEAGYRLRTSPFLYLMRASTLLCGCRLPQDSAHRPTEMDPNHSTPP